MFLCIIHLFSNKIVSEVVQFDIGLIAKKKEENFRPDIEGEWTDLLESLDTECLHSRPYFYLCE